MSIKRKMKNLKPAEYDGFILFGDYTVHWRDRKRTKRLLYVANVIWSNKIISGW